MYKCNLKFFLQSHGLKQKDLAERSGLTDAQISRIVRQDRQGDLMTWFKICEALDCNIYDLWGVEDGKAEKTKVQ